MEDMVAPIKLTTMIKENLTKIVDYIKSRLVSGSFDIYKETTLGVQVILDGECVVSVFTPYRNSHESIGLTIAGIEFPMDDEFLKMTAKEQILAWEQIEPKLKEYRRDVLIKEKEQELKQLREDIK